MCGLEGRQSYKTFGNWELGNAIPEAKRRVLRFCIIFGMACVYARTPSEFERVWHVIEEEWGWEPLTDDEWRALTNQPRPMSDVTVRPAATPPSTTLSAAHRKYLLQLFEQKWAGVSMSLFDQTLGHKLSLLKIYTPLPVDFAIHGAAGQKGPFRLVVRPPRGGSGAHRGSRSCLQRNLMTAVGTPAEARRG